eukprot:2427457-Lingulodinium_polyedra.AAC.1
MEGHVCVVIHVVDDGYDGVYSGVGVGVGLVCAACRSVLRNNALKRVLACSAIHVLPPRPARGT